MNRRDFISAISAAGASLACSRFTFASAPERLSIIVIGAGVSGLVASYELMKSGHEVRVLEAQERVGGRVYTIRDFADGQHAEGGAARIPKNHEVTHKYVKELKLQLIPFYPTTDKFSIMENGRGSAVGWDRFADTTEVVMSLAAPDRWSKIKGGNDLLPKAFSDRLGSRVSYNSIVRKIESISGGVSVSFTENNAARSIRGDVVVSAVPLTTLRNIEFSPAFSDARARLISTAAYDSASRVFLQTKTRFWQQQKLNGFGFGENGDEVWESSFGEDGHRGILQSYTRGSSSYDLTRMSPPDRINSTTKSLDKLFPGLTSSVEKGLSKCWTEDPWVRGAWAHLSGEQMSLVMKPEGRIHFAGEHLSLNPSWMQGALQSGLRVVYEINSTAASYKTASGPFRSRYYSA